MSKKEKCLRQRNSQNLSKKEKLLKYVKKKKQFKICRRKKCMSKKEKQSKYI